MWVPSKLPFTVDLSLFRFMLIHRQENMTSKSHMIYGISLDIVDLILAGAKLRWLILEFIKEINELWENLEGAGKYERKTTFLRPHLASSTCGRSDVCPMNHPPSSSTTPSPASPWGFYSAYQTVWRGGGGRDRRQGSDPIARSYILGWLGWRLKNRKYVYAKQQYVKCKRGEDNSSDLCVDLNQIDNPGSSLPPVAKKPKTQAQNSNHGLKVETQHQGDCLHVRKTVTNSIHNISIFLLTT